MTGAADSDIISRDGPAGGAGPDDLAPLTAPALGPRAGPASVVQLDAHHGPDLSGHLQTGSLGSDTAELGDEALREPNPATHRRRHGN